MWHVERKTMNSLSEERITDGRTVHDPSIRMLSFAKKPVCNQELVHTIIGVLMISERKLKVLIEDLIIIHYSFR